jgi:hypothetical protein
MPETLLCIIETKVTVYDDFVMITDRYGDVVVSASRLDAVIAALITAKEKFDHEAK